MVIRVTGKNRSLRTDLFLIVCLSGILPVILLGFIFLKVYEDRAVRSKTERMRNECFAVADHLYLSGYPEGANDTETDSELTHLAGLYGGRIMVITPDLKIIKDTYSKDEGKYLLSEEAVRAFSGETVSRYDKEAGFLEVATPVTDRESGEPALVMLTSADAGDIASVLAGQTKLVTILIVTISAVIAGIALLFSVNTVSRFTGLSEAIENIKEGFGEEEISEHSYKETVRIREAFNHLLQRTRKLDDSRSEFVANVSHELKTPITSIKILAESLTAQEDVPNEIYREFMEDIVNEVDREDKIINDLLSLVKMDRAGANLQIEKCDIDEMIEAIVKRLSPIAGKAGVELVFETIRPVVAEVDETKLSLAITNVIENGIKYNHEGGTVKITLDSEPMMFTVTVEDTGIGIPEEDVPNIFERFYRVDKSHSREIGGTGLGLAIARGAVLMHKGAIKVESRVGEGSRFDIKIPLSYIVARQPDQNDVKEEAGI